MSTQADHFSHFRSLQGRGRMLVLPNAWDAASARMTQSLGAEAVATSSAALAWSHGRADGADLATDTVLLSVPLTVDSEGGYSAEPETVAAHVLKLIEAGACGINLEDGVLPPELLCAKIRAIKTAARVQGADIFINARSDVYLHNLVPDERKLDEAIRRGKLYADAGADGLFHACMTDLADIRTAVAATDLPVNILIMRNVPTAAELREAGVRRVSAGALIARSAYGQAKKAAEMLLTEGRYDVIFATSGDCPDFNSAFKEQN